MKTLRRFMLASACLGAALRAQTVTSIWLAKNQQFEQTSAIAPSGTSTNQVFEFSVSGTSLSGIAAPTVVVPAGTQAGTVTASYDSSDGSWNFTSASYTTITNLNAAYGSGNYGVTVNGTTFSTLGFPSGTLFPTIPALASASQGAWSGGVFVVDATQALTLTSNTFATNYAAGKVTLAIHVYGPGLDLLQVSVGGYNATSGTQQNTLAVTVPAFSFTSGSSYDVDIVFGTQLAAPPRTTRSSSRPTRPRCPVRGPCPIMCATRTSRSRRSPSRRRGRHSAARLPWCWPLCNAVNPREARNDDHRAEPAAWRSAGHKVDRSSIPSGFNVSAMMHRRPLVLAGMFACVALLPAQTARLVNISTNGQVGVDFNNMVGGFVIGGGPKTVLIRAIGPGLGAFGVPGTLADPFLTLFDGASKVVATNDSWSASDLATMTAVGAFPLPANSKDAAIVTTLQPGNYTAQISGLGAAPTGTAILEVYDASGGGQLINIATRLQVGSGSQAATAGFVVSPGSGARKLLVRGVGPALAGFGLPGTLPDPKLVLFDSGANVLSAAVANGSVSALATATAQAGAFPSVAGDAATIVTLNPGSYTVQLSSNSAGTSGIALIEVYDITNSTGTPANLASATPTLYYASLRPAAGATNSTASGYATILLDPNTNVATVNLTQSGLSSTQTSAHLVIGTASSGNFVLDLPRGQVSGLTWTFPAKGAFSSTELINALKGGQIFVSLDSANYPSGELQGGFALTTGSTTFKTPAAPPALPANALTAPTRTDAARFLIQATFGPTTAEIDKVASQGINKWIDDQIALPATGAYAGLQADMAAFPNPTNVPPGIMFVYVRRENWAATWWKIAITSPDQLRQRMALALSEILVVGDGDQVSHNYECKVLYYDILVRNALGNFRQLLDDVTLSPTMGWWLSYLGNMKADPVKGTAPDENYAREVQQLFTIGLVQLHPDGTLMLDAVGQPIPTYNQKTITETAKVFTGWSWATAPETTTNPTTYISPFPDRIADATHDNTTGWLNPMRYFDFFHDKTQKSVVSLEQVPLAQAKPTIIPANQSGPQDLKAMLDTLFNHPNTGPFICKQLIQRLVTSNPSPGYVYRVAQVFANDGTGTRGNLAAVARAILTDYEARSSEVLANVGYGKLKEPMLRATGFFRALKAAAPNGRYLDSWFGDPRGNGFIPGSKMGAMPAQIDQQPLESPSVFNFFTPTYSPPGAAAAAGIVAPEMEITDSVFTILVPNFLNDFMYRLPSTLPSNPPNPSPFIQLDYSELLAIAKNPTALTDWVNLIFCGGQMTAATRAIVLGTLQNLPAAATDTERAQTAIHLATNSPDGAVQL